MKAYTEEVDQKEVILDMNIWWVGDMLDIKHVLVAVACCCFLFTVFLLHHHHYSFCSYDGDVDIDAEVQAPIVAGVKGLQVSVSCFSDLCINLILHTFERFTFQVKPILDLAAQRYAEGHSGAPHWSSAAGRRSHHIFHSAPSEYQETFG